MVNSFVLIYVLQWELSLVTKTGTEAGRVVVVGKQAEEETR